MASKYSTFMGEKIYFKLYQLVGEKPARAKTNKGDRGS
jgi:hypothetical protein